MENKNCKLDVSELIELKRTTEFKIEAIIYRCKYLNNNGYEKIRLHAFIYKKNICFVPVNFKDEVTSLLEILNFINSFLNDTCNKKLSKIK